MYGIRVSPDPLFLRYLEVKSEKKLEKSKQKLLFFNGFWIRIPPYSLKTYSMTLLITSMLHIRNLLNRTRN